MVSPKELKKLFFDSFRFLFLVFFSSISQKVALYPLLESVDPWYRRRFNRYLTHEQLINNLIKNLLVQIFKSRFDQS